MKSLARLVHLVAAVTCSTSIDAFAQRGGIAERVLSLEQLIVAAEVTVIPELVAYPMALREVDLKRLGCTVKSANGKALATLFDVLRKSEIKSSEPVPGYDDPRLRIVLTKEDGTTTKLMFKSHAQEADGLVHGTVDGAYAAAAPSLPKDLREWSEAQLSHTPAPKLLRCAAPTRYKTPSYGE